MKVPTWVWFFGGLALSSMMTASIQSSAAASRAGAVQQEVRELKREIAKLTAALEPKP